MSEHKNLGVEQKALSINLDDLKYGTIVEIGAGQEVARHFFSAGAAAGTIQARKSKPKNLIPPLPGSPPKGLPRPEPQIEDSLAAFMSLTYIIGGEAFSGSAGVSSDNQEDGDFMSTLKNQLFLEFAVDALSD